MDEMMSFVRTRTASLLTELDKKLLVVLRDGRTLIGELISVDQFANVVLKDTIERIHVGEEYGDIERGVFIVRGENVVLLGEVDPLREEKCTLRKVSMDDILEAQRRDMVEKEDRERKKNLLRHERGLPPHMPDMGLDDFA